MTKKQFFMMEEVLGELAMDSESDMEPEGDDFWPDVDDFVIRSSKEAVLNEPVVVLLLLFL